jgi:hypothetical protein
MPIPVLVLLWGLLAITVITAVGRWCRAHPGCPEDRWPTLLPPPEEDPR